MTERRPILSLAPSPASGWHGQRYSVARGIAFVLLALITLLYLVGCDKDSKSAAPVASTQAAASVDFEPNQVQLKPRRVMALKPATRPAAPLAKDVACVTPECHTSYANAAYVHGPVSERACNVCHDQDAGNHTYPLLRNRTQTCTRCHAVAGTAMHQHKALEQGCESCHDPHASAAKFLLTAGSVEQTCARCHQTPLQRFAHDPFAKGNCTACHQPHQSEFAMLLRGGERNQHCYTCHTDKQHAVQTARVVHEPVGRDCLKCHNAHTSPFANQLKQEPADQCLSCHKKIARKLQTAPVQHGAMLADKRCGNCHEAHTSDQYSLLPARTDQVCLKCHDRDIKANDGHTIANMKPKLAQKVLHGPNRSGHCSACHDPHGAKYPDLLQRTFPSGFYTPFAIEKYELCFSCHERQLVLTEKTSSLTNFRNGAENLHFVHVNRDEKGRSCKTCHDLHASDQPNHMATGVPFEGSKWAMPLKFEKSDDGGTCSPGCHTPRTYGRAHPSTRPASKPATGGTPTAGEPADPLTRPAPSYASKPATGGTP